MALEISTIFYIAAVGIITSMLHTLLKQAGREDWAFWVTLVGFIFILIMVINYIQTLFQHLQRLFKF